MKSLLIVEDDPSIRTLIKEVIGDMKLQLFEADDGDAALEILHANKIDVLITDLVMPKKNGIELIMQVKSSFPDIQLIAISGGGGVTGSFDYLPVAGLLGASQIIKKPFLPGDIRDAVNRAVI